MWFNPIMIWLLKSPFHFFVSKNMMLITYTGRKSGKTYTIPVNYIQDGNMLYITSWKERTWWRNLRDGGAVKLRVQGREITATPRVSETEEDVTSLLGCYLNIAPNMARYFDVGLDSDGNPQPEDLATAAIPRVMVTLKIGK
jgi:deazaflavin-dependent oxidoreductase (nitroreductase family)